MAYYFDPADADDLKLLNADVRTNSELANVANATEDFLRNMYSEYNGYTQAYDVKLRGYLATADPDDTYPTFKQAYKQTIADLISYVLINYSENEGVKRDKRGNREQEYFDGFNAKSFPNHLFSKLTLFDITTPLYY